jgi:predicted Rossmann-fold nucleotide-binding protein
MSSLEELPQRIIRDDNDYKIILHGLPKDFAFGQRLPENTKFILATTGLHKKEDLDRVGKHHDPGARLMAQLFASEDSEELEPTSAAIAMKKIAISITASFNEASAGELEQALQAANIPKDALLIDVADDRSMYFDPRLRDYEEFQKYKDYPLVKECFAEGTAWPGHRIKELYDLMGGPIEFLNAVERAHKALPKIDPIKYANLSQEVSSGIAMAFRSHDPEKFSALKDGIVIEVIERGAHMKFPNAEEIGALKKSGQYADANLDMFEYMRGQSEPYSVLREDEKNPYFETDSAVAKVWEQFTTIFDVPRRAHPRKLKPTIRVDKASILTNDPPKRQKGMDIIGNPRFIKVKRPFKSLADMECQTAGPDAILMRKPKGSKNKRSDEKGLITLLEPLSMIFQAITHKGLYDNRYTGKPLIIETSLKGILHPALEALYLRKAIHDKPSNLITYSAGANSKALRRTLVWNSHTYKASDQQIASPDYDLCNRETIQTITGVQDFGFVFSVIGSASSGLPSACKAAYHISYQAAQHGMTQIDGGGTRFGTIMGEMIRGALNAYQNGHHNFHHIGARTDIASRKEGSLKNWLRKSALQITQGNIEGPYVRFADQFHFINFPTLATRQHPINGMGDAQIVLPGGGGTLYEAFTTALHNMYVKLNGNGLYPGFSDRVIPLLVVNSQINGSEENRYYTFLSEMFNQDEMEMMGVEFHKDGTDAFERLQVLKWQKEATMSSPAVV